MSAKKSKVQEASDENLRDDRKDLRGGMGDDDSANDVIDSLLYLDMLNN